MTLRCLTLLLALLLSGCSSPEASAAPRRRAVRSAGETLLGPSRAVRVGAVPAGAAIVYHRQGFFFVMDADGANETQITFDESRVWEHVAISFDRRFAVANEQLPNPNGEPGGFSRLWIFDLQAATVAQLLPGFVTAGNGGVDWDRNGFIYFAAKQTDPVSNPRTPEDFLANAGANDIYRVRYDEPLASYESSPGATKGRRSGTCASWSFCWYSFSPHRRGPPAIRSSAPDLARHS